MKQLLSRSQYTKILAAAAGSEVGQLSQLLQEKYQVSIVLPAQKTLTMMQFREPVKASLFYLGEVLCSECIVEVAGFKGAAVMIGDDFAKVTSAAIIDAAYNGKLLECEALDKAIRELEKEQLAARGKLNAGLRRSKVDFNTMGEQ